MFKSSQAKTKTTIHGLRVTTSSYGDVIPVIYGRTKVDAKLISALNWRAYNAKKGKKGKISKGKKGGGAPQGYLVDADFLLGWRPITSVLGVWSNKDYFPCSFTTITVTPTAFGPDYKIDLAGLVPISDFELLSVIAVQQDDIPVNFSVTDYLGDGTLTVSDVMVETLVNSYAMDPSYTPNPSLARTYAWNFGNNVTIILKGSGGAYPWGSRTCTVFIANALPTNNSLGQPLSRLNKPQTFNWDGLATGNAAMKAKFVGCSGTVDLGIANTMPNFAYEVIGACAYGNSSGDANPMDVIRDLFYQGAFTTNTMWDRGLNQQIPRSIDMYEYLQRLSGIPNEDLLGDLSASKSWCFAHDMVCCFALKAQVALRDIFTNLADIANSAPFLSEGKLKFVPYDERSHFNTAKHGFYIAPTSTGPVFSFDTRHFVCKEGEPPVIIERNAVNDDVSNGQKILPTVVAIEYIDAGIQGNLKTWSDPNAAAQVQFAAQNGSVRQMHEIPNLGVAQRVAAIQAKRNNTADKVTYKFKLPTRFQFLEPMDLVLLTEEEVGLINFPVRLTSVTENQDWVLEVEAEQYVWGMNSPLTHTSQDATQVQQDVGADPGVVNTPVIFEPVPGQYGNSPQREIWFAVSGVNPNYGGCDVQVSVDGGSTFDSIGSAGQAITGFVDVGAFPAAADPDVTNTLNVDLTESAGELSSVSTATADGGVSAVYLEDGSVDIPYEVITYSHVVASAPNKFALDTYIRRSAFGAPTPGMGVLHAVGKRVAVLDGNILKVPLDDSWVGLTLHFKFQAYNQFAAQKQDISTCTDYPYTVSSTVPGTSSVIVNP